MEFFAPRLPTSADIRKAFLGASRRYLLEDHHEEQAENQAFVFSTYPQGAAGPQGADGIDAEQAAYALHRRIAQTRGDFPRPCCSR